MGLFLGENLEPFPQVFEGINSPGQYTPYSSKHPFFEVGRFGMPVVVPFQLGFGFGRLFLPFMFRHLLLLMNFGLENVQFGTLLGGGVLSLPKTLADQLFLFLQELWRYAFLHFLF